jgi:hypothetical protein
MRISMTAYAAGLAAVLAAISLPAPAQEQRANLHRRPPLRIEITRPRRLVRQCVDWHVVERRANGDTVVPRMRCWWASR